MLTDPTPHRVSACPVHFIWDGRGQGRVFVRVGFLAFLVAGALFSGAVMLHVHPMRTAAAVVAMVAFAAWSLGQVLTARTARMSQGLARVPRRSRLPPR